jgi:hypothetical protein
MIIKKFFMFLVFLLIIIYLFLIMLVQSKKEYKVNIVIPNNFIKIIEGKLP